MSESKTKRLFTAVKIQPSIDFQKNYDQIRFALKQDRITWVHTSNLHLTLKFFGETQTDLIPGIHQCLQHAVTHIDPFDLTIRKTGVLGSVYDPKVIWFGLEAGKVLQQLYEAITNQLKTIGIYPDRQNFVPHLTIGRIKQIIDKQMFQDSIKNFSDCVLGSQKIDALVLYESILKRDGPLYLTLHKYELGR